MIQRLYQNKTAVFDAPGRRIQFTFDPVPFGLAWSGSISITGSGTTANPAPPLDGIIWQLFRNGTPFLTWQDHGMACNVQGMSSETIVLVGNYIGPAADIPTADISAQWTGWSDDSSTAPVLLPYVSGSNTSVMQVYNGGGKGQPLEVVGATGGVLAVQGPAVPANMQYGHTYISAAPASGTTTATLVSGAVGTNLWSVTMAVTAAYDGTTAGSFGYDVLMNMGPNTFFRLVPNPVQASTVTATETLQCYGLPITGDITVNAPAFGGTSIRVSATAIYS